MNKTPTILVISESRNQFALAASMLKAEGYNVRFTGDVRQSRRIAKAVTPELIISELAVPDIDGLQICRQFRTDKHFGSTPILLVGDLSKDSSIVADGRRCGANDYVQKPFTFNTLAKKAMEMARQPNVDY